MKIAFLLSQSIECPSGLGRYFPLSKELVQLGHEVTILALHPNFASAERAFTRDGVRVKYVGQMHVHKEGSIKRYFGPGELARVVAASTLRLIWAALMVDADVFHLGKPQPINGIAALIGAKLRSKPLYVDCDDYEAGSNRFQSAWQRRIVQVFEDHLPRFCRAITVNTRFTQDRYEHLGYPAQRIFYVSNGVDRTRFSDIDERRVEELRKQWGLAGKRVLLYVGSLDLLTHAVDLLLDAFAVVVRRNRDVVLVLVGGGKDYEPLVKRVSALGIKEHVRVVGRVSPEDVKHYLSLGDLTVDPVLRDDIARGRSPLKVVESLAVGVPVVTGDIGDRAELLGYGDAGELVEPDSVKALWHGMERLLWDPEVLSDKRAACLRVVHDHYWDVLVHRFARVYEGSVRI